MERKPRGYVGAGHETIGSDILAVVRSLTLPHQVLGAEQMRALESMDPNGWYPIGTFLELMDRLEKKLGRPALFKLGGTLFRLAHGDHVKQVAKSARDIIHALDGMYHQANRGTGVGGWTVTRFEPGLAELDKNTPHHCGMEEGILTEALRTIGVAASVKQRECFRNGADVCRFVITSAVTDARWG